MKELDAFFQNNKKIRYAFIIAFVVMWFWVRFDTEIYENTLISYFETVMIQIGICLAAYATVWCFPYVRDFFKKLSTSYKAIFVFVSLFFCYTLGGFLTYCFLKINQPSEMNNTELVQSPIRTATFTDFVEFPGMKKIFVCADVRGEERTFWFPNSAENQALYEAKHLTLTIAKGRLGYDYIMRKDIIK